MNPSFERLPETKSGAIIKAGLEEFSCRTYADAKTDRITENSGISKGLLFHYFGTKKGFYLYCLEHSLKTLVTESKEEEKPLFYDILFSNMERKMRLCVDHSLEMKFLNMASGECSKDVKVEKDALLASYGKKMQEFSYRKMVKAVKKLSLKGIDEPFAVQGLMLYTNALISQYLMQYQDNPEQFFTDKEVIRAELRKHIDLMLYGICKAGQENG